MQPGQPTHKQANPAPGRRLFWPVALGVLALLTVSFAALAARQSQIARLSQQAADRSAQQAANLQATLQAPPTGVSTTAPQAAPVFSPTPDAR